MFRGEVWWAELPKPSCRRPVLILSRDKAVAVRSLVAVIPLTRTIRGLPTEVVLDAGDSVPETCAVNADVIVTIAKSLLKTRICRLSSSRMAAVADAVKFALDLS